FPRSVSARLAPRSTAVRFSSTRRVCSLIPPATSSPVLGSIPTCPDVNTSFWPPCSRTICACEYGPIARGASPTSSVFFTARLLASLDRDALCQVARLGHVAAARDRGVVRAPLPREDGQNRLQHGNRGGHVEHVVGARRHLGVALRGHGDDAALARAYLHHVAHHLLVRGVARAHEHHRHVLVDQRDRAVLHLGRRV